MAEEIGFENGRNSNFQGLVTLTLDPAIRHTVVHHSSTSTYIPNFIEIEETFCGRTDGHFPHSDIIRSTFGSRPKNRPFTAQEVRNLLLNDLDEEALSDDDYHCSELETESESDTDQVDNVPDNGERHAVILLLFMGVGHLPDGEFRPFPTP